MDAAKKSKATRSCWPIGPRGHELKRDEMGMLEGLDDLAKCRRYMKAY